jgi:methyltransferase
MLVLFGKRVAVAFPDTVLEDKESLRDKTAKLGLIARACVIYGADLIEVFGDPERRGEGPLIRRVLEYLETPQYLRKRLYPLDEALKYAGILPPLRIPSHKMKVPLDRLRTGEVREGVVNSDETVEIGLDSSFKLRENAKPGARVTVRVLSTNPPRVELAPKEGIREYWGYVVEVKKAADVIEDERFRIMVATSRLGAPLVDALGLLRDAVSRADSVKLIFGSPSRGLFDIFGPELSRRVEFVLNLYPEQHVETVRTEEAIFAGLGLLGLVSVRKA